MDFIDKVFYINLDRRKDRNLEVIEELEKMKIPKEKIERFRGIPTQPGCIGCSLSHLAILKLAKVRKYSNVLIFEDDIQFLTSPEQFEENLKYVFTCGVPWDVFILDCNLHKSQPINEKIKRVLNARTTLAYIVNCKYYNTLIDNFEEGVQQLIKTKMHWIYAIDVYWNQLQEKDLFVCFNDRFSKMRTSISDTGYYSAKQVPTVYNY